MPTLQARETALYTDVWGLPRYADHAPGELYVPVLVEHCPPRYPYTDCAGRPEEGQTTVLDAGTGSGKGALALVAAGYDVTCCDLTRAGLVGEARQLPFTPVCLWQDVREQFDDGDWRDPEEWPEPLFDAAYCTDVLEHIPEQFTMLAVRNLLDIVADGVLISVSTQPDAFGAWVGQALHQTVRPFVWWRDALREVGRVVDARDLAGPAVFWVAPR